MDLGLDNMVDIHYTLDMENKKVYKFAEPMNADEVVERFTIVEERGERVLVTESHSQNWNIVPTFCYLMKDLIEA